ncbi:MoxR family ATPase [Peptoniphilus sp. AGMB00490]|uniref:MoxR family ATPase n=2 Tax=Peptoniphilus TaxID=162289 RepID=A0ACD6B005_9FIRM|nr:MULTISPECIES: MoxR family ATPase [Peptoniphilus]NMW85191.1 MoxR family ATPase [Peptoniphilus faecalis]OLR65593.1 ATPase [Peptoniphilus porci]
MRKFLLSQGVSEDLLNGVDEFIEKHELNEEYRYRIPKIKYKYYGKKTWEKAIAAILSGDNILLSGPKATGKNVLAENLAYLFKRPLWTISLNITSDPSSLIGSDTFKNNEVILKKGPVYEAAEQGGFAVFDEINMAKNEALSVVHSTLDYRRVIDVSGYGRLNLNDATRFIATMNYGYIGTRDLNEALVSRFLVIDMPTIAESDLEKLFKENTNLNKNAIKIFTKLFLDLQEKSLNSEISSKAIDLRGLLSSIELMNKGLGIRDSLELGIVDKTFDSYEREIVTDVIDTLFIKNIERADLFEG